MDEETVEVDGRPEAEDLSGILQQLEALRSELGNLRGDMLYRGTEPGQSGDNVPETDGLSYEARLKRARDGGDMLEALRVKQEAAKVGVVLL